VNDVDGVIIVGAVNNEVEEVNVGAVNDAYDDTAEDGITNRDILTTIS
jgi:hypothetical protein